MPLSIPAPAPPYVKTNQANTFTTGAQSLASATSLLVPTSAAYAPTADGSLGYDSTQDAWSAGGAGAINGKLPRVVAIGHPAESKINNTTSDQDFTSIFTIPASYLIENRALLVIIGYQAVTGVSTATITPYLKLGSTKVVTNATARNLLDSVTRSMAGYYIIHGTAAAGASVNVETHALVPGMDVSASAAWNNVTQPVALATNGALNIVPGITYSATGSTETWTVRTFVVLELN